MNSVLTGNITLSLFGESHGKSIGIIIDGFPPGFNIDLKHIKKEMDRRKPGKNILETKRKEEDNFEIISGIFNGKTTGAPICCLIFSNNIINKDYIELKNKIRPGHSDYSASIRYRNYNDYRGGGHFSGRLTAPIVFAGSLCKQFLIKKNIHIASHIKQIYNIEERSFEKKDFNINVFNKLNKKEIPLLNESKNKLIYDMILNLKKEKDSIGGIIECAAIGVKAGIGNPFFHSLESQISHLVFSIPSIKGIMFGSGNDFVSMKGSESNDIFYFDKKKNIKTKTNHNGGILGGISNGMPIVFKCIVKSTSSIGKIQNTINQKTLKNEKLLIKGRHDPSIILRIPSVIESVLAIVITNAFLEDLKWN